MESPNGFHASHRIADSYDPFRMIHRRHDLGIGARIHPDLGRASGVSS
jgi:hypothetical protein